MTCTGIHPEPIKEEEEIVLPQAEVSLASGLTELIAEEQAAPIDMVIDRSASMHECKHAWMQACMDGWAGMRTRRWRKPINVRRRRSSPPLGTWSDPRSSFQRRGAARLTRAPSTAAAADEPVNHSLNYFRALFWLIIPHAGSAMACHRALRTPVLSECPHVTRNLSTRESFGQCHGSYVFSRCAKGRMHSC